MDIGMKTPDGDFTLRAAALIINIVPEFLKTALTSIPEEVVHIISKE